MRGAPLFSPDPNPNPTPILTPTPTPTLTPTRRAFLESRERQAEESDNVPRCPNPNRIPNPNPNPHSNSTPNQVPRKLEHLEKMVWHLTKGQKITQVVR